MTGDDEVVGGPWVMDPEVRDAMRLEAVRRAYAEGRIDDVIVECEELLTDAPDHVEALTILANATLDDADSAGAVAVFEHVLRLTDATPDLLSGLALARLESCDIHGAITAAQEAIRLQADLAEAHYTLSIALEFVRGRRVEAINALAAAHQLAPDDYPLPLAIDAIPWEAFVGRAAAQLESKVLRLWSGVPVHIEERPDLSTLTAGPVPIPPTVRGLFTGSPDAEQPETLRLFAGNLIRLGDESDVIDAIATVFEQEADAFLAERDDSQP